MRSLSADWGWLGAALCLWALLGGCGPVDESVSTATCSLQPRPVNDGGFDPDTGWWDRIENDPDAPGEGRVRLDPDTVSVDEEVTLTLTFQVGASGIGPGGGFAVRDPVFMGMRWANYGAFVLDPDLCTDEMETRGLKSEGLITARASSGSPLWVYRESCDPNRHRDMMTEVLSQEGLSPGDQVTVTYGDTGPTDGDADGNPACTIHTPWRAFQRVEFRVASRFDADSPYKTLEGYPLLDVLATESPVMAAAYVPSQTRAERPFPLRVVGLDRHGNPTPAFDFPVTCAVRGGDGERESPLHVLPEGGVATLSMTLRQEGIRWIDCATANGFRFNSNPIRVTAEAPSSSVYWGDLHVHNGHTYKDGEGNTVDENIVYARDVMALDFGAEVPKANPLEIDGDSLWDQIKETCVTEESKDFVPLIGYEWMGDSDLDGHHNVYFDSCEGALADDRDIADLGQSGSLYEHILPLGRHAVVFPHATRFTGHNWNIPSEQQTAAEVFSVWGDSLEEGDEDGSVQKGLLAGNILGFVAASDNHDGFMGNPLATYNDRGGLAALISPSLTRSDLFDALRTRQTYATDGARILLDFWAEDQIGGVVTRVPMGQRYVGRNPLLRAEIHGTAPLSEARLVSGRWPGTETKEVATWDLSGQWSADLSFETSQGPLPFAANSFWYLAVTQADGARAWASPLWIDHACGESADPMGICDNDKDGRREVEGDANDSVPDESSVGCQSLPQTASPLLWLLVLFPAGWPRRCA